MEIVKVNSLESAARKAFLEVASHTELNIAITGGNFGMAFLDQVIINNADIRSWNVFFTDERITSTEKDVNSINLIKKLNKARNLQEENIFPFNHSDDVSPYSNVARIIDINNVKKFDITILSLGDDGHLAGHFSNSIETKDPRFCITNDSPKPPKIRISFNINWLINSSKLILSVIGSKKSLALQDLIDGNGLHSRLWNLDNLILITDRDI